MARTNEKLLALCCLVVIYAASLPVSGQTYAPPGPPSTPRSPPSAPPGTPSAPPSQTGNYTGRLRFNYYARTCPQVDSLVNAAVTRAFNSDRSIIAGLIRLFFHDCFVRGCDASVLLDGLNSEKQGAPNLNSLRGFEVIDNAKASVEAACPGIVSCADIISFAARDSIVLGGGVIPFGLWLSGRKDGSISIAAETLTNLPAPFLNYAQLVQAFQNKGLTENDMIVLSTAHTIGIAHCATILSRLYNFQGTNAADPAIDPAYVPTLKQMCPPNAPGNTLNMEMRTPTVIDVNYIQDVLGGKGLFESDNALRTTANGMRVLNTINRQQVFSPLFSLAVLKMGAIEPKTGNQGNIRINCRTTAGAVPGP